MASVADSQKDHGQSHHESENEDRRGLCEECEIGEAFPSFLEQNRHRQIRAIRVLSCGEADRATAQPPFSQLNLIAQGT